MTTTIAFTLILAAFVVLMAFWVVRTEDAPKKGSSFIDPKKSYSKAKEMGLKLPNQFEDALPGV